MNSQEWWSDKTYPENYQHIDNRDQTVLPTESDPDFIINSLSSMKNNFNNTSTLAKTIDEDMDTWRTFEKGFFSNTANLVAKPTNNVMQILYDEE